MFFANLRPHVKFNITIKVEGVNDNAPKMVRGNHLIKIVESTNHKITEKDFMVQDKDGDEIFVEIVSDSELGSFVHVENKTKPLKLFTNKGE